MQKKIILGCLLLLITFAQSTAQHVIDSLLAVAIQSTDDKTRADLFHQLASESWDYDFNRGLDFAQQSHEAAIRAKYPKGIAIALSDIGLYYYFTGEYAKAKEYYQQSVIMGEAKPDTYMASIYIRLGNLFRETSSFDSARFFYRKASSWVSDSKPSRALAFLYFNTGLLHYQLADFGAAKKDFRKSLIIREKLGDSSLIADSWKVLGAWASSVNEFDSAHWYFRKVKGIAERYNNPELGIYHSIYQGELLFKQGEFIESARLFTAALDSLAKHDYKRYRAQAMKNIGRIFEWQGSYEVALKYFYDALKMEEAMHNQIEAAYTYSMIGWAFVNQKELEKARQIAEESGVRFRSVKNALGISDYYTLSGFISFKENKFQEAQKFYDSALVLRRQAGIPTLEANVLNYIAQLLIAQGKYDDAMIIEQRVFQIFQTAGNRNGMAVYYNNMTEIMLSKKNYEQAEHFALLALHESSDIRATKHMLRSFSNLSTIYTATGQHARAGVYYKKYIQVSDSLFIEERTSKQAQYNALYELENREKEIEDLNQQNIMQQAMLEAQKNRLRFQNTVLILAITGCALLASLAFTLYAYYKSKSKANVELTRLNEETVEQKEEIQAQSEELTEANQALIRLNHELIEKTEEIATQSEELRETNEMITAINRDLDEIVTRRTSQLQEAYKELDTFFYRSSHDFRRPLTTFMGLAEVASVTVKDKNALDLFEKVKETARSLDKMLVKLQSISDVGAQQLVFKEVLITEIFDNVCQSFHEEIQRKGIQTSCEVTLKGPFISYPAMIKIIVENLVENSIQFAMTEKPFVRLTVNQQEDNSILMIMDDNGQGIAREYQSKVFEMYFRASERSKGNGLGLYIVKKAVDKLKGTIRVETNYGVGSRFMITLPTNDTEEGWAQF